MAKLYELTADFNNVFEYLENDDIDLDTLENTLQCIECELSEKADGYGKIIKNISADINGLKEEETRLSSRRKTLENRVKWLKGNIFNSMEAMEKTKIKTDLFSFTIQKNPPAVQLINGKKIPERYLIPQPPKADTESIKNALKEGTQLDFAQLVQGKSLRIR
ncbi:MAG: siphovirus Gp157 family protein [Clostridia bacterium]|jgi:hypothetical protein|nr:siphovirus Gp157 family protein [Clostridia bacterium]MCI2014039.1 siphovirus Gp157 family protein [Clostridia bacterium]